MTSVGHSGESGTPGAEEGRGSVSRMERGSGATRRRLGRLCEGVNIGVCWPCGVAGFSRCAHELFDSAHVGSLGMYKVLILSAVNTV